MSDLLTAIETLQRYADEEAAKPKEKGKNYISELALKDHREKVSKLRRKMAKVRSVSDHYKAGFQELARDNQRLRQQLEAVVSEKVETEQMTLRYMEGLQRSTTSAVMKLRGLK